MYGLALGEHVRMLLVSGLCGCHPLESRAHAGSSNLDLNVHGLALGDCGREGDGERVTVGFYAVADMELNTLAFDLNDGDIQIATFVRKFTK